MTRNERTWETTVNEACKAYDASISLKALILEKGFWVKDWWDFKNEYTFLLHKRQMQRYNCISI